MTPMRALQTIPDAKPRDHAPFLLRLHGWLPGVQQLPEAGKQLNMDKVMATITRGNGREQYIKALEQHMAQLRETNDLKQATQHKHPEVQYQVLADSLNQAASVFGEKKNEDPRYQEVKNKRMELLENRRRLRSIYSCATATRKQ